MSTNVKVLIDRAKTGSRLASVERRRALNYLMAMEPDRSNIDLGELFQVSEKQIRLDKLTIREERARSIKEEDISCVIADIAEDFERQIRSLEAGKKKCEPGTRTHLEYIKAIFKMQLDRVQALQNLGFYPKNLGTVTVDKYEFKASVTMMDDESKRLPQRSERDLDALDVEFKDVPLLPGPLKEIKDGDAEATPNVEHPEELYAAYDAAGGASQQEGPDQH